MGDYITRKQWDKWTEEFDEAYFSRREERDRRDHQRWEAEHQRLMNPPKPPPRREEPREPTIEDASYADFIYRGQGLLNRLDKEQQEEELESIRPRRKPTVKRKGGGHLVDSYT